MYQILIPRTVSGPGVSFLQNMGCEVITGKPVSDQDAMLQTCDAILAGGMGGLYYGEPLLKRCINCKIIANYSVGYENIDVSAAEKRGIYVTNSGDSNANAVAEHTVFLILACAKMARIMGQASLTGNFAVRRKVHSVELQGKTLGIIGYGRIGKLVAQKCTQGFGMKVLAYDAYLNPDRLSDDIELVDSMDTVLGKADFLTVHLPLTNETKGIISAREFEKMKETACFINVSRGRLVVEKDLIYALQNNIIGGAGLDVFEQEPTDPSNPLLHMENVVTTPHCAANTVESLERMELFAAKDIWRVLNGEEPLFPVNHPQTMITNQMEQTESGI